MDSTASTLTFSTRIMPALAILRHDLQTLWGGWLVRLWFVATALLTFFLLTANWGNFRTAPLIASLLFPYLVFPWFLVAIALGVTPVTGSRAEALADGILSRSITRYEYLLAAWAARVVTTLGTFLLVTLPAVMLAVWAKRPVPDDPVTFYGVAGALIVVALVLTFLVSFGFLLGTVTRSPLLAVVVLLFVWVPINLILNTFSLEEFSPISLNQALTTLLRQPWREVEADPEKPAADVDMEAIGRQFTAFLSFSDRPPVPQRKPGFFEHDNEFEDFSLLRVLLGYGIPTLAAVGLTTLSFCRRDM